MVDGANKQKKKASLLDECESRAEDFAKKLRIPFKMGRPECSDWDEKCYFDIEIEPLFRGKGVTVSDGGRVTKGWETSRENKKALSNLERAIKSAASSTSEVTITNVQTPSIFVESVATEQFYRTNFATITIKVVCSE